MGVRRLLSKTVLLAAPFVLVLSIVFLVDPYNMFRFGSVIPQAVKEKNLYHSGRTMPFSNTMWKMLAFKHQPNPNVMFGDSRLSYFDMDSLQRTSGESYFNFGIPGGNYRTMNDLFLYADSLVQLKNVYVQVAFRNMGSGFDWDLYQEPNAIVNEPLLYLTNRRVLEATALNIASTIAPDMIRHDQPPPDQWQQVLETERTNATNFVADTFLYGRLRHMAARCKTEGAKLVLVEYPTHPDAQQVYIDAGLDSAHHAFLETLSGIAPVIALDRPGLFPTDATFWRDPLHLTVEAQRQLIPMVWGENALR